MQVSFRLLAQAKLLIATKAQIDRGYVAAQEEAKQRYMRHLSKIREEYIPQYMALQQETNVFWEEVKLETGIESEEHYAVLEDGSLVRTAGLTGGLWEL